MNINKTKLFKSTAQTNHTKSLTLQVKFHSCNNLTQNRCITNLKKTCEPVFWLLLQNLLCSLYLLKAEVRYSRQKKKRFRSIHAKLINWFWFSKYTWIVKAIDFKGIQHWIVIVFPLAPLLIPNSLFHFKWRTLLRFKPKIIFPQSIRLSGLLSMTPRSYT